MTFFLLCESYMNQGVTVKLGIEENYFSWKILQEFIFGDEESCMYVRLHFTFSKNCITWTLIIIYGISAKAFFNRV
jgi:hypothetical protein